MGTINYETSEYITVGIQPLDFDLIKEELFDTYESVINITDDMVYDEIRERTEEWFDTVYNIITDHDFEYFDISVEPGYYDGFSINIKTYYDFEDKEDQEKALKEASKIHDILKDLVENYGLCVCYPGWSTTYLFKGESLKAIDDACNSMATDIKAAELTKLFE